MGNFNPKLPTKYVGTNKYITFFVSRDRAPTGADYRQPETGTLYSVGTVWQVGKNPTTGVEGNLWMLSKIVANIGYWVQLSTGGTPIDSIQVQSITAPGVNPVTADSTGLVTINGAIVANHSVPIETRTRVLNTYNVEVQYAASAASTTANKSGLAHFDSAKFSVDANGFVTLNPSDLTSITIQTFTTNGTYTPTLGMRYCIVEAVGGGGGGGGATSSSADVGNAGGGGGSGSYSRSVITAATIGSSQVVTIGASGTSGANTGGNGGSGGTTSLGSIFTALGGSGGVGSTGGADIGGAGGGAGSAQVALVGNGGNGGSVSAGAGVATSCGGSGAASFFGGGSKSSSTSNFMAGSNGSIGGGGAGAANWNTGSASIGGAGGSGYIIITEYIG